ncbi:DEAD/DEAH box helicase [Psychromonas sp. CNPT3]|uniref:DEAD/DEAH box helicase n=1 Tax=Psychromonas sp. CNPT3 TaxID=314282 RepID=UPI0002C0556A|nr:DEAD/DEAH box helicase [Psychromonas sp. CNPT3]AGH80679.1 DEAD/DEAH box helicase [Psychromonas sp. CNPT3]
MSFSKLGLSPQILQAISELGYKKPTPIQEKAIPVILKGRDVIACAQTGTGKTGAFVLPILERLKDEPEIRAKRIRVLILTPTRELAIQIEANVKAYSQHLSLTSLAMYGGVDDTSQKEALIAGVDILVATPGRLLDMYTQRAIHFDEIQILVLDEADRMLDMGFIGDINKILERLPEIRQNLLFSATLSPKVRFLAKTAIENAVQITIREKHNKPKINQYLIPIDKDKKSALLSHLITENKWDQALIFIETKRGAAKLVSQLEKRGVKAESFHSGRSQSVRETLLADFKAGTLAYLVATGVASRGIDIDNLNYVINYDLPDQADDYIHRIGRTGRAGATGHAISFVSRDDFRSLCYIEKRLGALIPRKIIAGFEPTKELPESSLKPDNKKFKSR